MCDYLSKLLLILGTLSNIITNNKMLSVGNGTAQNIQWTIMEKCKLKTMSAFWIVLSELWNCVHNIK
jgi:hypothetical protein